MSPGSMVGCPSPQLWQMSETHGPAIPAEFVQLARPAQACPGCIGLFRSVSSISRYHVRSYGALAFDLRQTVDVMAVSLVSKLLKSSATTKNP